MVITVSLDLSTKSSGYAIFEDNDLKDYGCITASSADVIKRINKIVVELDEVLSKYETIDKVVVEEVRPENTGYGVGNQHTQKVLLWLQGAVAILVHDKFNIKTLEYMYPNEWRKMCGIKTGRGIKREELKQADIAFIEDKFKITVNDDVADAIGIGYANLNNLTNELNW